ncbi:hypothetical protein GVN16_05815 [Emticicia sp. CRIBPO]|uniref:hypothetical protein n=1 Tax=Emticicia sp. CRIBPO TaxID=2683258 RepID=UPI0014120B73|nr:hypothetical protein [Emticicia sp. CRIBPO]NBA85267.1 hypothetical protein [Emticicia sp. CRIBPO]
MKTSNSFMKALSLGLAMCLVVGLYNCKPKETEPEIPDFEEGYKDVKPLPAITPSTPAAVTTTPASVTASAAASAASSGLASGSLTAAVTSTAADVAKVVSAEKAETIASAFTPNVVSTLQSGGALPASLKAEIDALKGNAALAAYLPSVTLPTVNGAPVSLLIEKESKENSESLPLSYPSFSVAGTASECTDQASAAYESAKKILDDSKTALEKTVNDTYNSASAAISSATCKTSVTANFTAGATAAKAALDASLSGIQKLVTDKTITATQGSLLTLFAYFDYSVKIGALVTTATASTKACDTEAAARIAALKAVQTTDLGKIKTSYDAALAPLKVILEANFKLCHDQGQGGN